MGSADIKLADLKSRDITRDITDFLGGRTISLSHSTKQEEGGGLISWIVGAAKKVVGFVINTLGNAFSFSFSKLWSLFVSTSTFIWNFNFNATDEQLDQQVKQAWNSLAGMAGGTLGNLAGYLLCGIAPGAVMFSFNEALGLYALKQVGEEMLEELASNVASLVMATINATVRAGFTFLYKNARRILKAHASNPIIKRIFGNKIEDIAKSWGAPGSKPWSFALAVENAVESIPNEGLRNFIEEFLEEAWEGCVEAGYIVANAADTFLAMQKAAPVTGQVKVVEVTPNRNNKEEKYILAGGSELVKPAMVNLITTHQMVQNYDLGTFVGDNPLLDYLKTTTSPLIIKIEFASVDTPPWNRSKQKAIYQISDVKRSKLDYDTIRQVCGGSNGCLYGRYRASYDLDNGRPLWAFGGTADEAEDLLNRMLTLTDAEPLTATPKISITPKLKDPITKLPIDKPPIRVYAKKLYILNQEKTLTEAGRQQQTGKYIKKNISLWIYTPNKPLDFDAKLQALLERSS